MIRKTINYLKEDYNRRTLLFAGISIIISLAFGIYNGILGLVYDSIWHASIFAYYLLLMIIKFELVFGELHSKDKTHQHIIVIISFIVLIITTIAMIAPAIILIQNKRTFDFGLIPAIAMAAYTTYSITMSIINLTKVKSNDNVIVKQIRLINLITALMSILVLQNTLIIANGEYTNELKLLSIFTSIGIILSIVIIVVYSFVKNVKHEN